jgi:hypothetical protein
MKKKYLNTLVALALLAGTWGAFTYYEKRKSRETPKVTTSAQEKILPIDGQHIQSIRFGPHGGIAVTCRREGGTWAIVEPQKLAADQTALSSFVNSLTSATVDEVVDPHPSNLKDFGLDPPAFSLEGSTDAQPAKFTLLLGDETPTSGGIYAQVAGNPRVVTLASYLKSSLEKSLFDLRDRRALALDADQIQKIEAESKEKKWTLAKNPEGVWDLVLPPPVRADRFAVEGLVSQLRGLTLQSIVAEDKEKSGQYGFGAPELRLQLSGPSGIQTLVLGKKQETDSSRSYAMNSALTPVFTLNSDFLTQFKKDPADLREKDLFLFSAFEVKRVEIDAPKGHRVFEREKGNEWKQTAPSAKNLATAKMDTLLSRLRDLRADSFPKGGDLAQFGLTKPAYQFMVRFGDKNQTETVQASKVGEHVYARRTTDSLPCELPKTALDDLEKALNDL